MSGKPGAGAEEEGGCAEAAVLAVPGASPPICAARSQPPQRPQFPKQRQQALLPPMPRLRVDDSLPPPELHLQALIDACHDAQLPRAGAGERTDGVLLGMPCRMASLAQRPVPQQHIPRERGHSQHGLALLSHRAAPIELLWAGKAIIEGGHSSSGGMGHGTSSASCNGFWQARSRWHSSMSRGQVPRTCTSAARGCEMFAGRAPAAICPAPSSA